MSLTASPRRSVSIQLLRLSHSDWKKGGTVECLVQAGRVMPNPDELKMNASERDWWEGVRARGALWYFVTKGLFFLIPFPSLGC